MVTLTASGNSVVFTFENSNHYLYGNGEIEVPKDSLILVIDKSDIVTFRKIDGDVFVSFNINDSNFSSKDEIEEFYKENMVGGGGGSDIDSGTVQTMIDESISGKVDTSVFDTYSAATNTAIDAKANKTAAVGGYGFGATNNVNNIQLKSVSSGNIGNAIYYPTINGKGILTSNQTFARNNYDFQLIETSAITSSVTSASTDSEIPSAKAVWDAIPASITVDSAFDSGSTNPLANSAITTHLNNVESVIATSLVDLDTRKLDASAYTPTDLTNYYTKSETSGASEIANALVDLDTKKLDASAYTPTDLSNYYTKSETSGATEIANALSAKSNTSDVYTYIAADGRIKIQNASGVNRKSIGLNLPIYSGSSTTNLSLTTENGSAQGANQISGTSAVGIGSGLNTHNYGEVAVGVYNYSSYASLIFGNSGNTLFSVGNGTASSQRKNAFEIRQNNDIYVRNENGYQVKLQDYVRYKIVKLTQAEYDDLEQGGTVDQNTVYLIVNNV
ncbi:MAG: hypothetical protein J6S67_13620 [Methanobrevibacter sp.]|nr:hypothetical protein [Methanobrevibacter sp.]